MFAYARGVIDYKMYRRLHLLQTSLHLVHQQNLQASSSAAPTEAAQYGVSRARARACVRACVSPRKLACFWLARARMYATTLVVPAATTNTRPAALWPLPRPLRIFTSSPWLLLLVDGSVCGMHVGQQQRSFYSHAWNNPSSPNLPQIYEVLYS